MLAARPLTFERRSPDRFLARFGDTTAIFRAGELSIGPIGIRFSGSSEQVRLEGNGKASPSTYLLPGLKGTFPQYPRLALRDLYPGVDAIFYGNGNRLEYDLVAAPNARLENVQLVFEGAEHVRLDKNGALRIEAGTGVLEQKLPRVFQADGREIAAHYEVLDAHRAAIRLGPHDARLGLTIDPELAYTRYFGGSGSDSAALVTTDPQGNLYIAGLSNSVNFPTTNGVQPKLTTPLLAISNGGQTVTRLPVGEEDSVISIAGSSDGAVIYALTPGALYVSSDRGATWQQRPSPFQSIVGQPSTAQGNTVNYFAVDPIDPSRLFLATNLGLLSSGSGGLQGWGLNETGLPVFGNGSVNASWVAVSPLDHLTLYAIASGELFKSTNHGVSWQELNPPGGSGIYGLAAALAGNGDLYVAVGSSLFKSADGGTTWQMLSRLVRSATAITLDPNNGNVYYLDQFGLQASSDGGLTFKETALPDLPGYGLEQVVVDAATGTVYVGLQSSIYVSTDGGKTVRTVQPLSTANVHAIAALGGQAYAGVDSPSVPFAMKLDPTGTQVLYSTFIGGSQGDTIDGIAVDAQGNCTVAGRTYSPDFPVIATISGGAPIGAERGFVSKLSADGTRLIYSTVLSASLGATPQSVALDASGSAYITGQTESPDFPTTANSVQPAVPTSICMHQAGSPFSFGIAGNAFVSKLSADGSALVYSTFLTGSCGSFGSGIAVDAAGEAIVVGYTASPDFPATPNAYQAAFPGVPNGPIPPNPLEAGFVTKLSAAGDKVLASSFLGGGNTQANAVALDKVGNISLTGATGGMALGATPGAFQQNPGGQCPFAVVNGGPLFAQFGHAFVLKLDPALSMAQYMTYLDGSCTDSGTGISLDATGNAWLVGTTDSPDFPTKSLFEGQGIGNGFVSELSPDGSQLLFSSWTDSVSLALDASGAAYLAGSARGISAIPKVVQASPFPLGPTTVEVMKIDPSTSPTVVIDGIGAVTGFPPAMLPPFGGIAPGQLIQINGRNLGPETAVNGQVDSTGRLTTLVGNTSVFFDDIPAPLVSVGETAIQCFAPFEISGTTGVTVVSNSQKSNAVRMGVNSSAPEILSITNQDGTQNSPTNPAQGGETIVIYASGLGETSPLSVDGLVNSAPLPVPLAAVTVYLPGRFVQPQFVGAAPGMIAGIVQVNVQLPVMNYSSNTLSVGLNTAGATIYVSQ
jgi:uncharacterized protein (TIGR03437 family)